jgi:hypothetical protein
MKGKTLFFVVWKFAKEQTNWDNGGKLFLNFAILQETERKYVK